MNILFWTNVAPVSKKSHGGAESSIALIAKELVIKGHKVFYLTAPSFTFFPKIKVYLVGGVKYIEPQLLKGGHKIKIIGAINDLLMFLMLLSLLRIKSIQLVYMYYELPLLQKCLSARKYIKKFRIVMRMAGLHWYEQCLKNRSLIPKYQEVFNSIDSVNYIQNDLEGLVYSKFKELDMDVSFKHSFCLDIGTTLVSDKLPVLETKKEKDTRIIVTATRFSNYQKRQDVLIRAFDNWKSDYPLQVILIGDGETRVINEKLIDDLNLGEIVQIVPFIPQNELWEILKKADLLCHPCNYEGLSKIIIESMSIGLPVLASNVPTLNGYIVDNQNGYLVENNPETWALKIKEVLDNQNKMKQVRVEAFEFIKTNYNSKVNVGAYEKVFQRLTLN